MTLQADADADQRPSSTEKSGRRAERTFWLALSLAVAATLVLRLEGLTADVSWLLTMCERMLGGEKAYVDIFETTPPVPTLLYMPAALVSRLTGLNSALALVLLTYAVATYCLWMMWRIMPPVPAGAVDHRGAMVIAASAGLFLLANDAFAQREYFAACFALPMLAVLMRHQAMGELPTSSTRAMAALLAGLTVAIKPPLFILPGAAAAAFHLWITRDIRSLYSSGLIAASIIGVALTAISLAAFPEYLENLTPYMRDLYVPLHTPLTKGLMTPQFWTIAITFAIVWFYARKNGASYELRLMLIAGLGFAAAFAAQEKYYWYHSYPAIFFLGIGAFSSLFDEIRKVAFDPTLQAASKVSAAARFLSILIMSLLALRANADKAPEMNDLRWAEGKSGFTASAISTDISLSFPLSRKIDAVWIDRIHGQWAAGYARRLMRQPGLSDDERALYQRYFDDELERTATLIAERRPQLLFVDKRATWLREGLLALRPDLLDPYQTVAEDDDYLILERAAQQ